MAKTNTNVKKLMDRAKRHAMRAKLGTGHRWDEQVLAPEKHAHTTRKYRTLRDSERATKPKSFGKWRHYA
jgi:hypothetical protein